MQVDIIGTFDSNETAAEVTRALNAWFLWIMDGAGSDIPELFEDFGLNSGDYALERDVDVDWDEQPTASAESNLVIVCADTMETQELLQEMLESLGAFEIETTTGD